MKSMTYNVEVQSDGICHAIHVIGAADGYTVSDLDRALKVHVVALLVYVHGSNLFVVDLAGVCLGASVFAPSFDTRLTVALF